MADINNNVQVNVNINVEQAKKDTEEVKKAYGDLKVKLEAASAAANLLSGAFSNMGKAGKAFNEIKNTISGLASTVESLSTVVTAYDKSNLKAMASAGKLTFAQKALNLTMKAMPIFALISGLSLLGSGIASLISLFKRKSEATREAEVALKEYEEAAKESNARIVQINDEEKAKVEETALAHRNKILEMKKSGATAAEIAQEELKYQQQLTDTNIKASEDRTKAKEDELKKLEEAIKKQEALQQEEQQKADAHHKLLIGMKAEEKSWFESRAGYEERIQELKDKTYQKSNEAKEQLNQLIDKHTELNKVLGEESRLRQDAALKTAEMAQAQEERENAEKEAASWKYMSIAVKEIEEQRKLNQALLKADGDYLSEEFEVRQSYAKRQFDLDQESAKNTLDIRLKFGDISKKEYQRQQEILLAQQQAFSNEQQKQLQAHNEALKAENDNKNLVDEKQEEQRLQTLQRLQKELMKMMKQEVALQKTETEEAYKELIAAIEAQMKELPDGSEQYQKMAENVKALKLQLEADLQEIDSNAKKKSLEDFASEIDKQKAKDLANADLSAREKYNIERSALDKKMKLYDVESAEFAALKQQQAELDKEFQQGQLERIMGYAEKAKEVMSGIFEFSNAQDEAKLQKATEQNDYEKEQLQAQLDANLISKDEYNKKVKQSDDKLAKEQAKIKRKQAIQDKANAAFDIIIQTALGISKAVAASPVTGGLPWSAVVAAMGALQLATVLAQPIPKAARGMYIRGASHALGGVPVEAEGGEMIINRRSSSMFAPLLSAINEAGGGVPFVSSYSDGGFALRDYQRSGTQGITSEAIAGAVREAMQEVKIYTAIEDINEGNKKYTAITDSSSF